VPDSLVNHFSARAKTLLDREIDRPRVSTVQALVIMSAAEAMLTMDSRGWLYCGEWRSIGLYDIANNNLLRHGG